MENNKEFWQFSDQLRVHTSNLANLSLNDSIWCTSYGSKRPDDRRNFDVTVGGGINSPAPAVGLNPKINDQNGSGFNPKLNDYNGFNDGWKMGSNLGLGPIGPSKNVGVNDGFNKGVYSKHLNQNFNLKGHKNGGRNEDEYAGGKNGKKKSNNGNKNKDEESKNGVDKRFKTLPPSESLPRNETIGGYIFVCNNDTMLENLRRQLFGLPPRYRDSVRAITPGLPLFLYNYSTHQLHGIYEAASFGGSNIDPMAWEDKKCPGESRFPAQVKVVTRKICEPLEEDSFRPILHHYDGPKFRLELSVPEALSLLDIFVEDDMYIFTEISP